MHREYRYKDNVSMIENGTMVSAYNTKSFVFLPEKSVGDPTEDNITTVNIPAWVSRELNVLDNYGRVEIQVGGKWTVCTVTCVPAFFALC